MTRFPSKINQLCNCEKMTNLVHLVDPLGTEGILQSRWCSNNNCWAMFMMIREAPTKHCQRIQGIESLSRIILLTKLDKPFIDKDRYQRKKRDYVGKIPKLRGGVWPKPTSWCLLTKLFLACQNDSEVLKHVLQKGWRWYLINFNT